MKHARNNWRPLPEELTAPERELAERLRELKDAAGITLAELGVETHYTRSSWHRWLNGERLVTRAALTGLAEALGAEPRPLLVLLERAEVSRTDGPLSIEVVPSPAATGAASPPIAQLPPDTLDFSGRDKEVANLLAALSARDAGPGRVPVCAVTGGGGLGKTALAVHVAHQAAHEYPDGQFYLDLRGADPAPRDPAEVLVSLLTALGVPVGELPADLDGRAARFRTAVSGLRILILLDNALDAAQVKPLIPAASGCAVLVTSRGKLSGLAGAYRLTPELLPEPDARALLESLIGAERAGLEAGAFDSILTGCGGLPLALRIAGARVADRPSWSLAGFAARLADRRRRLDELSVDDLAVRACFELSYACLPAAAASPRRSGDVAKVFRFAGLIPAVAFGVDEVAAVLGDDAGTQPGEALEHLVNVHLLADDGDGRYVFHDLVRSFAARLFEETESPAERTRALRRLTGWYARATDAAAAAIDGAPSSLQGAEPEAGAPAAPRFAGRAAATAWFARHLEALSGAIDAADACARPVLGARIAVMTMSYVFVDMTVNWQDWLERALGSVQRHAGADDGELLPAEAWLYNRLGVCHGMWERNELCAGKLERALALHRECADRGGEITALHNLANVYALLGEHDKVLEWVDLALRADAEYPGTKGTLDREALVHGATADSLRTNGRYMEAIEHYELAIKRHPPNSHALVLSMCNLGDCYRGLGLYPEAVAAIERSVKLAMTIGDRFLEGDGFEVLARVHGEFDRPGLARECWNRARVIFEELDFTPGLKRIHDGLAELDARPGSEQAASTSHADGSSSSLSKFSSS